MTIHASATSWWAVGLAALLAITGVLHFVHPSSFDAIVPHALPGSTRAYTLVSGAAELAVAVLLVIPRTRVVGAWLAVGLFLAVFPANIQMAVDWADRPLRERLVAYARLPLQIPLVAWAALVALRS